jgi:hypothetical protein
MHKTTVSPQPRRRGEWRDAVAIQASIFSRMFDVPVEVPTTDLSPGGMFLPCDLLLDPGDRVLVAFTAPGTSHQIMVDAQVVRTRHLGVAGMGLEFGKLPGIDETILRNSLKRHRERTAPDPCSDGSFRA